MWWVLGVVGGECGRWWVWWVVLYWFWVFLVVGCDQWLFVAVIRGCKLRLFCLTMVWL